MLRSLSSLLGSSIVAKDGEIGHVRDLLFHDRSWLVRYLVVETGSWLLGRRVLLSPIIAHQPELQGKLLRVALTRDAVQNSPGFDTDLPVSRQQEVAMTLHYGWPAYWAAETAEQDASGGRLVEEGDPNLRSAIEILKYAVKTSDGDLGQMADLIIEDANWFIRFLVVSTGSWLESQRVLVGTRWVGSISWADREIHLPHSRDEL